MDERDLSQGHIGRRKTPGAMIWHVNNGYLTPSFWRCLMNFPLHQVVNQMGQLLHFMTCPRMIAVIALLSLCAQGQIPGSLPGHVQIVESFIHHLSSLVQECKVRHRRTLNIQLTFLTVRLILSVSLAGCILDFVR